MPKYKLEIGLMNLLNRGGLILALILLSGPSLEAQEFSGLTSKQYQAKVNELVPKNLRVSKITVKVVDDVDYYSPTFSKIPPRFRWATHHRMSPKRFEERKRDYSEANMKVVFSQQYTLNKETRYVAIWEGKTPEPIRFWDENENIPVNGKADPAFKPFDDMLTKFLVQNQIPGATVAISDRGKLVYSKGFGYSHFEKKTPMNRRDRMRIASLSKPITAVAVLQLVQEKKLSLDDKIFDILQHQPYLNDKPIDPRLRDVTVLHCLQHTGGWDRGVSYDPMFRSRTISKALGVPSPPGADNIIRYMLNQPLDHDPGTRFAYSNFGFCLLGRVIEQIAGETYESHVQKNVLKPVGAKSTEIGESLKSKAKEVFYYGRNNRKLRSVFSELDEPYVPGPYGAWHLEAMDSHGGWIASAPDLVRFASDLDNPDRSKLLSRNAIEFMFRRPKGQLGLDKNGRPKAAFYACGWNVRPTGRSYNTWHGGLLNGTSTLLVRRHDGKNWAVLFNKSDCKDGRTPSGKIDSLMHQAASYVRWPD